MSKEPRGCAAPGRDVSNERVAAGFENHGIIRQIKLERLRPFFPLPYTGPMKWIKPCLSSPPLSMVSFNYRLIYDIRPITTTGSLGYLSGSSSVIRKKNASRFYPASYLYYSSRVNLSDIIRKNRDSFYIFNDTPVKHSMSYPEWSKE